MGSSLSSPFAKATGGQKTRLRVLVCGKTGEGKSSVINLLRQIDHMHEGYAPVGENETTTEMQPYPVIFTEDVRYELVDLPGWEGRELPYDTWYQEIFERVYNGFRDHEDNEQTGLLVLHVSHVFREEDDKFLSALCQKGIPFCCVYNKADRNNRGLPARDLPEEKQKRHFQEMRKQDGLRKKLRDAKYDPEGALYVVCNEEKFVPYTDLPILRAHLAASVLAPGGASKKYLEDLCAPLRIGFAGDVNSGKSTLINTLLPGVNAPTGDGEVTQQVKAYHHPANPNVEFVDLPGVGTVNWPKSTYASRVGLKEFHAIIIVCAGRLTASNITLRDLCQECAIPYFFVRTQVDEDIRQAALRGISPDETLRNIRSFTATHICPALCFLVDGRNP